MTDFSNLIPKFDDILSRGLCVGVGDRDGQMCIEAAICAAMDLPHGDEPDCVAKSVRSYKIILNDSSWSGAAARARGLRNLGIAQIGSRGVVDDQEFAKRLTEQTIRELIPTLFREVFPDRQECLDAADRCASEGTTASADSAASAARVAASAARAAWAAGADRVAASAAWAAGAAGAAGADRAAWAADRAAGAAGAADRAAGAAGAADRAAGAADKYLLLSASLALEVLRELNSPGCEWLEWRAAEGVA